MRDRARVLLPPRILNLHEVAGRDPVAEDVAVRVVVGVPGVAATLEDRPTTVDLVAHEVGTVIERGTEHIGYGPPHEATDPFSPVLWQVLVAASEELLRSTCLN
jgi:hypothetical protein